MHRRGAERHCFQLLLPCCAAYNDCARVCCIAVQRVLLADTVTNVNANVRAGGTRCRATRSQDSATADPATPAHGASRVSVRQLQWRLQDSLTLGGGSLGSPIVMYWAGISGIYDSVL